MPWPLFLVAVGTVGTCLGPLGTCTAGTLGTVGPMSPMGTVDPVVLVVVCLYLWLWFVCHKKVGFIFVSLVLTFLLWDEVIYQTRKTV